MLAAIGISICNKAEEQMMMAAMVHGSTMQTKCHGSMSVVLRLASMHVADVATECFAGGTLQSRCSLFFIACCSMPRFWS